MNHADQDILYAIRLHSVSYVKKITRSTHFEPNKQIAFENYTTTPLHEATLEAALLLKKWPFEQVNKEEIKNKKNSLKIVRHLLEQNANHTLYTRGITPLFMAVALHNTDCSLVELLLKKNAAPNQEGTSWAYWFPSPEKHPSNLVLHQAASQGNVDLVHLLLRHNANTQQLDHSKNKATCYASTEAIQNLLTYYDTNAKT